MGLSAASGKIICPNFYLQVPNVNFFSGMPGKVVYKSFISLWEGLGGLIKGVFVA